jgi:hypothetical protein
VHSQYSRTKKLRNIPELIQEKILVNMEKPLNFRFLKYRSINMNTHIHEKNRKYLARIWVLEALGVRLLSG